jgi:hypothetical protein
MLAENCKRSEPNRRAPLTLVAYSIAVALAFPRAVKVIPASRIKPQRAGMDVANASDY